MNNAYTLQTLPEPQLTSCYGLTETGQVLWFDYEDSPFSVRLEHGQLTRGRLVDLPPQFIKEITPTEVYRHLSLAIETNQRLIPLLKSRHLNLSMLNKLPGLLLILVLFVVILWLLADNKPSATNSRVTNSPILTGVASYNPIAPPSINQSTFTAFLAGLGSPALPEANTMYPAIVNAGGDPAVAAAFFEHESGGGRAGVAVYTKSLGNIRCSAGYSCYQTVGNGAFRAYSNWTAGARDWVQLLKYYREVLKLSTLEEIIPVYAPAADKNNPQSYIAKVKATVDRLRNQEH